jgi:hypothetical protein
MTEEEFLTQQISGEISPVEEEEVEVDEKALEGVLGSSWLSEASRLSRLENPWLYEPVAGANIKTSGIISSKYETNPESNKGIKIFVEAPATLKTDTGVFLPTSNAEPNSPYNGAAWTNPANAYTLNATYATAVQGGFKYTIWKGFTNLQGAIPTDATITGITVKCYAKVDTVAQIAEPKLRIWLSKNGADVVGIDRSTDALTTSNAFVVAGASNDFWGTTWARSDFTGSFGVMITGLGSSTPSTTYSIDYIQVIVHYSKSFTAFGETIADAFMELSNGANQSTLLYLQRNTKDLYIDKANLYLKGGLTVAPTETITGNTGATLPTDNAEPASPYDGAMWNDPTNAYTNNAAYATAGGTQMFTIWKRFGLLSLIPAGATITGIQVDVEGKVSAGTENMTAYLTKDGSTVVGGDLTSADFTTSDTVVTFGDSGNLWETTWVKGDFGEDFGVMLYQNSVGGGLTYSIDYINITVYYTITTDSTIGSNILPSLDDTYDLGSSSKRVGTIHAREFSIGGFNTSTLTNLVDKTNTLVPSDNLKASSDGGHDTSEATYEMLKQIIVYRPGSIRVKFDLHSNDVANTATGAIYINDVLVIGDSTTSVTYVTYSHDIGNLIKPGDRIQLWAKITAGTASTRNFRLYWDETILEEIYNVTDN